MMKKLFISILILYISQFSFAQVQVTYTVILRSNAQTDTMYDGVSFPIFGMPNALSEPAIIPAKTLYCNEGDTLTLHAYSISQGDHHTIHLHNMDADTRNDGDPATSFWLNHMDDTTYTVVANHAGTYLYHCHVADVVHVQMGMYGMIVVKAAGGAKTCWTGGPAYSKYYNWLTSEIDRSWHDTIPTHDPSTDTVNIPKYVPDYFLINGKSETELTDDSIQISAAVNEPVYIRLANIGFTNNEIIFPSSFHCQLIDSDGRPLPNAIPTDTIEISPGEAYGVLLMPDALGSGNIQVNYISMNSYQLLKTELVPYNISGYYGVDETENISSLKVYPNPADHILMVESESLNQEIMITDVTGKIIFAATNQEKKLNIDLRGFADGIYFLQCGNEKVSFVIQH